MGLKEQLQKLVGLQTKEVAEPLKTLDRLKRTADAAKRAGQDIRSKKV